jgi:hypothetical protein
MFAYELMCEVERRRAAGETILVVYLSGRDFVRCIGIFDGPVRQTDGRWFLDATAGHLLAANVPKDPPPPFEIVRDKSVADGDPPRFV